MTIASEIQRIQTNIANAYDALEAKGATMPATENTDNLVTTIDTISGGGGDVVTATNNTGSAISTGDKVWLNENSGSYSIDSFSGTQRYYGIQTVGSNIVDYSTLIASNFSRANALNFSSILPLGTADTWEFYTSIDPRSFPESNRYQFILNNSTYGYSYETLRIGGLYLFFYGQSQQLTMGVCYDSSGTNTQEVTTTRSFGTMSSFADIKCEFTGTEYNIYSKRSGETSWTLEGTISSSTKIFQQTAPFRLGSANNDSSNYGDGMPFYGQIDLQKTYFKINGQDNWKAVYQAPNVYENTLTGYAQEIIASGSTGDVLTLLPPTPEPQSKQYLLIPSLSGSYIYSTDGTTWQEASLSMPSENYLNLATYAAGKYFIGSSNQNILVTDNPSDNTSFITPTSGLIEEIAYGNNIYVGVHIGSRNIYISSDGINWTTHTNAIPREVGNNPMSITFGNGVFVASFEQYDSGGIYYSTDGINWTKSSTNFVKSYRGIIFDGTQFVVYGVFNLQVSTDGINWTNKTKPAGFGTIAFCNGVYTTGRGNNYYESFTSTDLTNWTTISNPYSYSYVFSDGKAFYKTFPADSTNIIKTSTDGINWTDITVPSSKKWRLGC